MKEKLKRLIESSESIMITAHVSPDPDAFCSTLLTYRTLKQAYPEKKIAAALEDQIDSRFSYLPAINEIEHGNLAAHLERNKPDLLLILDANNFNRISRTPEIIKSINAHAKQVAIIDHHDPSSKDESDIYIGELRSSCVEHLYKLLFETFHYTEPENIGDTIMFGILTDTDRFKYRNNFISDTFAITAKQIENGVSIEKLESILKRLTKEQVEAIGSSLQTISISNDHAVIIVPPEIMEEFKQRHDSPASYKMIAEILANDYTRGISGTDWGYVVYKDILDPSGKGYGVSLRANAGTRNVATIAQHLGGGGHIPAAGCKVVGASPQEVVEKVEAAIEAINLL